MNDSDTTEPATLSAANGTWNDGVLQVLTDAQGQAEVTLTSSHLIAARAQVKVVYQSMEKQTVPIVMEDAIGAMAVEAEELVADGQSTTDVYLLLRRNGMAVEGHTISFQISRVLDVNGQPVQPEEDGTFPGYGSIATVQGETDDIGLAYATYTAGTLPGTIEFQSTDHEMLVPVKKLTTRQTGSAKQPRQRQQTGAGGNRKILHVTANVLPVIGQKGVTTTKPTTNADIQWALNSVWDKQAQIKFQVRRRITVYLKNGLEKAEIVPEQGAVSARYGGDLINTRVEKELKPPQRSGINIYLVKKIFNHDGDWPINGTAKGRWMFVQDESKYRGTTFAHEAGHNFGLSHMPYDLDKDGREPKDKSFTQWRTNLMYPTTYYNGRTLTEGSHGQIEAARKHLQENSHYGLNSGKQ